MNLKYLSLWWIYLSSLTNSTANVDSGHDGHLIQSTSKSEIHFKEASYIHYGRGGSSCARFNCGKFL